MKPKNTNQSSPAYQTKVIYKILLISLIVISSAMISGIIYLQSLQPSYSGRLTLSGLREEIERFQTGTLVLIPE